VDEDDFGSSLESLVVKDSGAIPSSISVGTYSPDTGLLVITGSPTASHADFEAAIQQIGYLNTSQDPAGDETGELDRIIQVTAFDEESRASDLATATIEVMPVNDAPSLTGTGDQVTFGEEEINAAPRIITSDVVVSDPDSDHLARIVVSYSDGGGTAKESLSIVPGPPGPGMVGFDETTLEVSVDGIVIGTRAPPTRTPPTHPPGSAPSACGSTTTCSR
jgi:hypothetical protein